MSSSFLAAYAQLHYENIPDESALREGSSPPFDSGKTRQFASHLSIPEIMRSYGVTGSIGLRRSNPDNFKRGMWKSRYISISKFAD